MKFTGGFSPSWTEENVGFIVKRERVMFGQDGNKLRFNLMQKHTCVILLNIIEINFSIMSILLILDGNIMKTVSQKFGQLVKFCRIVSHVNKISSCLFLDF